MRSALVGAAIVVAGLLPEVAPAAPTPPSAVDLTRAALLESVTIAPDGKHIAALSSPDGEVVDLLVWSTDNLKSPPTRIRTKYMRFLDVEFLKNDRLLVSAVQPARIAMRITAPGVEGQPGHIVKSYVTDLQGRAFDPLLSAHSMTYGMADDYNQIVDATLISRLPQDPRSVIVEDHRLDGDGDIYSVDLYSMAATRIQKGSEKYGGYQVDLKGQLRARQYADFDDGKMFIAQQVKDPDNSQWVELFRSYAKDREFTDIVGFTSDPHVVLIASAQGGDKTGVFEYDIKQKKVLEPAFQHKLFEATGIIESTQAADFGLLIGFGYDAEAGKIYWVDPAMAALTESAAKALGASSVDIDWIDPGSGMKARIPVDSGVGVRMDVWSDDFKDIVFEKSGPRQPPEYYLLAGGKLQLLGKARPWIDTAALGDTSLVEYPARDGMMIPAFLTRPPKAQFGPGPYPTLIEPHGGPWARDEMDWDLAGWIQYFASRGYAVLQPQFRGSEGWGQKLWRAGDAEWGQKMQDDNDDGVKWLIAQHIADPKRVAIFGYSYGGYSALAASIRPNGLYQCAISGAGAGDLDAIAQATFDDRFQREFQHPTIKGLDALAKAKDAQIPVLLYHGDHDTTVDPEESRRFAGALRSVGKPVKLVEIKDMGHQYVFMTPDMMKEQLDIVSGFLKDGCKPGGL